jgi:hypothetical protein
MNFFSQEQAAVKATQPSGLEWLTGSEAPDKEQIGTGGLQVGPLSLGLGGQRAQQQAKLQNQVLEANLGQLLANLLRM